MNFNRRLLRAAASVKKANHVQSLLVLADAVSTLQRLASSTTRDKINKVREMMESGKLSKEKYQQASKMLMMLNQQLEREAAGGPDVTRLGGSMTPYWNKPAAHPEVKEKECPRCDGSGEEHTSKGEATGEKCRRCKGKGKIEVEDGEHTAASEDQPGGGYDDTEHALGNIKNMRDHLAKIEKALREGHEMMSWQESFLAVAEDNLSHVARNLDE